MMTYNDTRPTVFLHIGAHKTATTGLQRAFARYRDAVLAHGVLYPQSNSYHYAQHRLAFALRRQRDPARGDVPDLTVELDALRDAISKAGVSRILVSSEGLMVLRSRAIEALRKGLSDYNVHIIAVLRRPDDYLLSQYNQNAKGIGNNFTRPLSELLADPRSLGREISFASCIERWEDAFGHDAITLWRLEDGHPLTRMLSLLDLPEGLIPEQPNVNPSVPAIVAETIRLAKRLKLPATLQRLLFRLSTRMLVNFPRQDLSPADRQSVLDTFADENDALFARFGMHNTYR